MFVRSHCPVLQVARYDRSRGMDEVELEYRKALRYHILCYRRKELLRNKLVNSLIVRAKFVRKK